MLLQERMNSDWGVCGNLQNCFSESWCWYWKRIQFFSTYRDPVRNLKCLGAKQWKRNGWSTHDLLKESSVDIGSNPIRTWAMNQVLNSWTYLNLTKGLDKPIAWKRDFLQVTHSSQPCLELSLANHSLNLLRYESSALLYHLALVGLADRHGKAFFSPPIYTLFQVCTTLVGTFCRGEALLRYFPFHLKEGSLLVK